MKKRNWIVFGVISFAFGLVIFFYYLESTRYHKDYVLPDHVSAKITGKGSYSASWAPNTFVVRLYNGNPDFFISGVRIRIWNSPLGLGLIERLERAEAVGEETAKKDKGLQPKKPWIRDFAAEVSIKPLGTGKCGIDTLDGRQAEATNWSIISARGHKVK